jgi:exonuclease VII small subunit
MGISIYKFFQVTFNDYKRDYNGYLTKFLNDYEDNTEHYFIKEQKAIIERHLANFSEIVSNLKDDDENQEEIIDLFRNRINTSDKIKAFLEQRKEELENNLNTVHQQSEPEPIDLSDTSAVEKIIYLEELGIIDFLRSKTKVGISNTALASVLSGITGVKAETIKPSLNRLSNNDIIDNKHPYYTTKTVDKIKLFLSKLGF